MNGMQFASNGTSRKLITLAHAVTITLKSVACLVILLSTALEKVLIIKRFLHLMNMKL